MIDVSKVQEWIKAIASPEKFWTEHLRKYWFASMAETLVVLERSNGGYVTEWFCMEEICADLFGFSSKLEDVFERVYQANDRLSKRGITPRWEWEINPESPHLGRWKGE